MTRKRWAIRVHHPLRPGLIKGDIELPIEQQALRAAYITFKYFEREHCLPSHYWIKREKEFAPKRWSVAYERHFALIGITAKTGQYILNDSGVMWMTNSPPVSEGIYINRYFGWGK